MRRREEIVSDLRGLGLAAGDAVCVHSSLKSLGPLENGPDTVVEALFDVLGGDGTLMFPAFSFGLLHEDAPLWVYEDTPSCVGYLSEYFRTRYAAMRSIHVSHSYSAAGRRAEEFLTHPLDITPCGADSPLAKLMRAGGKVLQLGCGYNTLTAVHVFEEAQAVPYVRFHDIPGARYSKDGVVRPLPSKVVYAFGYDFERLAEPFRRCPAAVDGMVGDAPSRLLDGTMMEACVTAILKENPLFLAK
ncbi:MAG: AAC(3) family N-acetyltransferase [Victivallaceae bacterium]|nr:AAC(3) family N-acetyltransferase [Victivallaceae bacterium]